VTSPTIREISRTERASAQFRGVRARGLVESVDVLEHPERLSEGGWWALVGDFSGRVRAWRFAEVEQLAPSEPLGADPGAWRGPEASSWTSSMSQSEYEAAVAATRAAIREGEVYQVNVCRVLSAPLPLGPEGTEPDALALAARLARHNPAPHAGLLHVPAGESGEPVWVVSASPELYLRLEDGVLSSRPIKGTAREPEGLTDKDRAENVMITDLVRNDLQRVCEPGTVDVTALLAPEQHPGLVHLVSTVTGRLTPEVAAAPDRWARVLEASYPPGSVSGAPKSSALRTIAALEPVDRGPYCGAFGWVDADAGRAELAVAIRTFWWDRTGGGELRFGTGAGITWDSDPSAEWAETELKARRLVAIASSGTHWAP